MLDIKFIRNNPEIFDKKIKERNCNITAKEVLLVDDKRKEEASKLQFLQNQRNEIASKIAINKRQNKDSSELFLKSKEINSKLKELENNSQINKDLDDILSKIPNLASADVPFGIDENDNIEISRYGSPKEFSFEPKSHEDLGLNLNMIDFEQSTKMSGSRFSSLMGDLAKLERALSNFMLDIASKNGYLEISPPNIVKSQAMYNSGQLPKFGDDAFSTKDDYWLIPTAEVSLVNFAIKKNLKEDDFPMKLTAYTPCFRREAGSAGKDTRGMIRQHQFKKVELVCISTPEESEAEHEKMTLTACEILEKLKLPYKKMLLCTADMGFGANKTYDLEVWFPSQKKYREISSCSNCGDFQARRSGIKYKKDKKNIFAHTLNGSALAVGRTLIAIIENYQNEDGSITVPDILVNYLSGTKIIK